MTNNGIARMTLDRTKDAHYEGLNASIALAQAFFEQTGLRAYLDQYKVDHAFRLAKDGMKMSRVYIHRPSRENAMMFVISLGTMVSDVIGHVLKTKGIDTTTDGIAGRWFTLMFRYDRANDSEFFQGSDKLIDEFLDAVQALGLDPDHLIH